jgi:hypothetical protein
MIIRITQELDIAKRKNNKRTILPEDEEFHQAPHKKRNPSSDSKK